MTTNLSWYRIITPVIIYYRCYWVRSRTITKDAQVTQVNIANIGVRFSGRLYYLWAFADKRHVDILWVSFLPENSHNVTSLPATSWVKRKKLFFGSITHDWIPRNESKISKKKLRYRNPYYPLKSNEHILLFCLLQHRTLYNIFSPNIF